MCTFKSILPCLVAFTALVNCTVFVSCMDAVEVCGADNTSITLKKGEERPNIVFTLADDLGYGGPRLLRHPIPMRKRPVASGITVHSDARQWCSRMTSIGKYQVKLSHETSLCINHCSQRSTGLAKLSGCRGHASRGRRLCVWRHSEWRHGGVGRGERGGRCHPHRAQSLARRYDRWRDQPS